jgi:hypothetical protein
VLVKTSVTTVPLVLDVDVDVDVEGAVGPLLQDAAISPNAIGRHAQRRRMRDEDVDRPRVNTRARRPIFQMSHLLMEPYALLIEDIIVI